MRCGAARDQMVQPRAGFIGDWAPIITLGPIAGRVGLHEQHIGLVIRYIGVVCAIVSVQQAVFIVRVQQDHALVTENFKPRALPKGGIL